MLAKLGCTYVAVGHSERRQYHAEDEPVVRAKVAAAFRSGLVPILCVGEGLDDPPGRRPRGAHACPARRSPRGPPGRAGARPIVVAYEPVWAIGTGEVATPEDAQEVCAAIRTRLAELYSGDLADGVRILYGGSVHGSNIAAIMAQPDVDGALVGGASLDPPSSSGSSGSTLQPTD